MKGRKVNKVLRFERLRDEDGERYIPYCTFHWHQGVIKPRQVEICEERNCRHYIRFYENQERNPERGRRTDVCQ